jgi:hypothetical protein
MKTFSLICTGVVCALVLTACASARVQPTQAPAPVTTPTLVAAPAVPTDTPVPGPSVEQRFPDVVKVELKHRENRRFDVIVTMTSPYDTPQRYADGWRVLDPSGKELGVHTLAHDHADEQPFTRVQSGVEIPSGVTSITVQGRDKTYGFGGGTVSVPVPASP